MQYFLYFCARIWKKISKQVKRIHFIGMKQIKVFCMAMLAMLAIACNPIKTEATVDVTVVDQNEKPVAGVMVGRFNNSSSLYLQNADEKHETNAAGLARFELKTLEDLGPAGYDDEGAYFTFRAFDKQDEPASEEQRIWVEPGDKKTLVLKLNPSDQGGGDE